MKGILRWLPPSWAFWIYTVLLKPAPLRALAGKVICLIIPEEIETNGVTLALNRTDPIVSGNITLGCYEIFNLQVFERLLRPGMCVLDVGANIGLYSAIAARTVGHAGRVIAVEPDPTNCTFIERTKKLNGFENISIVQKAAGATVGAGLLYLSPTNKADHRAYDVDLSRNNIPIEITTLDSVIAEMKMPQIDVIKIDTQGFEYFVARGMEQLLKGSPHVTILMEFWPWGIAKAGGSPAELLKFFSDRAFVISTIDGDRKRIVRLEGFDSILNLTLERQHADLYLERLAETPG